MFIIVDPPRSPKEMPGFVINDPIEGWIFTWQLSSATEFNTKEQARKAIKDHYREQASRLQICKREDYHE